MRRSLCAALAAALTCAACGVPRKAGFDDVQHSLAARTAYRVHWNQGGDEDRAVADETRRLLAQTLTLETATQIALFNNRELQATYERLGVAQAEVVQAGLLRNPRISLHYGFHVTSGVDELLGSVTGAFLDLFLMPLKKKLAGAQFRREKLAVADAVLDKVDAVARAFFTVQASTQIVSLRRKMLDAQQAAAELSVGQHQAGNVSDLQLASEQAVYVQAKLELARAEYQLLVDREMLTRLLGLWGADIEYRVAEEPPAIPATEAPLEHLEGLAIARRLDLAAAREELQGASDALRLVKGSRGISGLDVGVNAHRDPDGPVTVGPTVELELPIFDQKQAEVARLRAQLHAAQHRADALSISVRSEVRQLRGRLTTARLAVDYYRNELVPLRERIVALAERQYNAMLLSVFQLLIVKQNEIDTRRQYIESVRDYFIARADLERALGTKLSTEGGAP
jgi:cobalt-zinc-cadmium efflux system outer membrane protein